MNTCKLCYGEIPEKLIGQSCPVCGCSVDVCRSGATKGEKFDRGVKRASMRWGQLIVIGIVCIFGLIMTAIFGNDPDKLLLGFCLVIALGFGGMVVYGIIYNNKHNARLHQPGTIVTKGTVVGFHTVETIETTAGPVDVNRDIIEYEAKGQKYRYVCTREDGRKVDKEGDEVDIAYNVSNPLDSFIAKDKRGRYFIIVGAVAFVLMMTISIVLFVKFSSLH